MKTNSLLALLAITPFILFAAQSEDTSEISIQIEQGCILDNGSGASSFGVISFGEYSSLTYGAQTTSNQGSGSIGFRCSPNLSYRIELGNGLNATDSSGRKLLNSSTGELVPYQLYQDVGRSQVWDDANAVSGTASGLFEWLPIFVSIAPQPVTPSAGVYNDNIEVVLIF
ncbi:spore coat U domain-containing protein [Pseudoalteromonas sp.]|uniref:Csu type fimbrial protein n=1 Tax=Pseudoalteromonas sp. TaxID=53249 RepID=UPI001BD0ECAD|nr:spore coat U domain-containing protein [Pseudoalteromonas sp.]